MANNDLNSNDEALNLFIKSTSSMLSDDRKLLDIINQLLIERNVNYQVPETFNLVDASILAQMVTIDSLQQKKIISRELALELMVDLFENFENVKKFESNYDGILLDKFKELYIKFKIKFEDLLFELNVGRINQKEFFIKYKELIDCKNNSIIEINETTTSANKPRKKR